MRAAAHGKVETLQLVIDSKANIEFQDEVDYALSCAFVNFTCSILMIGWGDGSHESCLLWKS